MNRPYLKLYLETLDNPIVFKDSDYAATWHYILLSARHFPKDIDFAGKRVTLKPGEFSTGRKEIAKFLKINESKVQRILKRFEVEQQIEQRTDRQCRIITVKNWDKYQGGEQRNEQQVNNECTTSEQRVNTKREREKERKEESNNSITSNTCKREAIKREFLDLVFEWYLKCCPSLQKHNALSPTMEKQIKAICKRKDGLKDIEDWKEFFIKVEENDFLTGRRKEWKAGGLLWITKPNSYEKIQAGFYDSQGTAVNKTHQERIREKNLQAMNDFVEMG